MGYPAHSRQFFAVPCNNVQSIMALADYKPVPNLPKYIRGIMHYQDQIVYLIDLRNRLGIAVILGYENRSFALIFDEFFNIATLLFDYWRPIEEVITAHEKLDFMIGIAETLEERSPVTILNVSSLSV
jgi:chemotaxis signal transduction protein